MLYKKNSILCFVFGFFLTCLGAAYAVKTPPNTDGENIPNTCLGATYAAKIPLNKVIDGENIPDTWSLRAVSRDGFHMYLVENYPIADEKTESNYALPWGPEKLIDSCVLLISNEVSDFVGGILDDWITKGLSAHYIISQRGDVIEWINPSAFKAQAAGPFFNNRSIAILLHTTKGASSDAQDEAIKYLFNYLRKQDNQINVKYLGSHSEARNSGDRGVLKNVDVMRKLLGVEPLHKKDAS